MITQQLDIDLRPDGTCGPPLKSLSMHLHHIGGPTWAMIIVGKCDLFVRGVELDRKRGIVLGLWLAHRLWAMVELHPREIALSACTTTRPGKLLRVAVGLPLERPQYKRQRNGWRVAVGPFAAHTEGWPKP